jgi:hypothetical protein
MQKINFALFRRGLHDPAVEIIHGDEAELMLREVPEGRRSQCGGVLVRRERRSTFGSIRGGAVTGKSRGARHAMKKHRKTEHGLRMEQELRQVAVELREWMRQPGRTINALCRDCHGLDDTIRALLAGREINWGHVDARTPERLRQAMRARGEELRQVELVERERQRIQDWCAKTVSKILAERRDLRPTPMAMAAQIGATQMMGLRSGAIRLRRETLERLVRYLAKNFGARLPRTAGRPGAENDVPVSQVITKRPAATLNQKEVAA